MTLLRIITKMSRLPIVWVCCIYVLGSCNKTDSGTSGESAGSLKFDSTSECLPAIINGNYFKDSGLSSADFIDLYLNVTRAGTYSIESNTVNGYSFKGSGRVGILGENKVRLYGNGIPVTPGTDQFLFRFGTSYCLHDVLVQEAGEEAGYTLSGAGGTCTGAVLNGNFVSGQQMNSSNTVTASIQITSPGHFLIATTTINGVTFTAQGNFTDLAQASITLTAEGTPIAAGTFNYPLIGNGTGCAFSVTFM